MFVSVVTFDQMLGCAVYMMYKLYTSILGEGFPLASIKLSVQI